MNYRESVGYKTVLIGKCYLRLEELAACSFNVAGNNSWPTNCGVAAATPPNKLQRCILTDYFNNYNFSKLK
jgi:hypothetical protein